MPPKSNAGRRVVPLPAPTSRLLWEARKTARNASDEGLVFPGKNGVSYLDATSVGRWFGVAAEKARVPWATPHTCRHTCASWLLERRLTITAVQAWLGHANAAITLGFYAHFVPDELPASPFGDDLGTMPAETSRDERPSNNAEHDHSRVISS